MIRPILSEAAVSRQPLLPWRRITGGHETGAEMVAPAAVSAIAVLPSAFFCFESCFDAFRLLCDHSTVPCALPGI